MNRAPAFQFYPKDWLSSSRVASMSPAEEGAYIRLLCHCWDDSTCSIPDDDEKLARLSRLGPDWFNGSGDRIRVCFTSDKKNGRIFNKRLRQERVKQVAFRLKSQKGGINSGISRSKKSKGGSSHLRRPFKPNAKPRPTLLSSSSKKIKTFLSDSVEIRLSEMLLAFIKKRNPEHREPNLQAWAKHIDLLMRVDGKRPEMVEQIIRLCQEDPFWQNNILSTEKLRQQYDTLLLRLFKPKDDIKPPVRDKSHIEFKKAAEDDPLNPKEVKEFVSTLTKGVKGIP